MTATIETLGRAAPAVEPTNGDQIRSFTQPLNRKKQGDGRTIFGIAVPWERWIDVYGDGWLYESFRSGTFDHQMNALSRIKAADRHMYRGGKLIGVTTLMRNDVEGLYWEGRASKTPDGDNALVLADDGALDQLSVGFRERAGGNEFRLDDETGLEMKNWVIRVKADLFEVAMVPEGAYDDGATVGGTRNRQHRELPSDRLAETLAALRELGWPASEIEAVRLTLTREPETAAAVLDELPSLPELPLLADSMVSLPNLP